MMRYYDVVGRRDTNGTWLLTLPALPETASFGGFRKRAFKHLERALLTTFAARIQDNEPLPEPINGCPADNFIEVQPLLYLKGALYMGMREKGISRLDLAAMLQIPADRVDRLLAVERNSQLDLLQDALRQVDVQLEVVVSGSRWLSS